MTTTRRRRNPQSPPPEPEETQVATEPVEPQTVVQEPQAVAQEASVSAADPGRLTREDKLQLWATLTPADRRMIGVFDLETFLAQDDITGFGPNSKFSHIK